MKGLVLALPLALVQPVTSAVASFQSSATLGGDQAAAESAKANSEAKTERPADESKGRESSSAQPIQAGSEIRTAPDRWRTFDPDGRPEYTFRIYDPYHQNILKADFPVAGNWFLEIAAFNNLVHKSRRNLDFSNVFADQIGAGLFQFVRHNQFVNDNVLFGGELRRFDDTFFPSDFRIRINGVADFRRDINAFNSGSNAAAGLFDAFVDVRLFDFGGAEETGHNNFDLMFLRGGIQAFRSDFHGLIFNDAGLGGRVFGELQKNRLRYDFAWLKLFQKNGVTGFIDFSRPSAHNVAIARLTYDDFLVPGWNSEWSFHYNRERRRIAGSSATADHDTYYLGAAFNGHIGRVTFNPAAYFVAGDADQVVGGVPVRHTVRAWMVLLDAQYKFDYWNFRAGFLHASGDGSPGDTRDTGFDAISDGVTLFGGPLSYWVGENIKFGLGDFVRGNSLLPSLRGANGAANHINPGIEVVNGGVDLTLSPRFELSGNFNYLRFVETGAYTNRVVVASNSAGVEENVFFRIKPFVREINQNVILDLGFSVLHPRDGLKAAFQSTDTVYSTFIAFRVVY